MRLGLSSVADKTLAVVDIFGFAAEAAGDENLDHEGQRE